MTDRSDAEPCRGFDVGLEVVDKAHARHPPRVVEIPTPEPGPGEILLKVTAAGACHSDEFVMSLPEDQYTYGLPLTLGHEGAGVVAALGEGVTELEVGTAVAVYGPRGCGSCRTCLTGAEQYCEVAAERGIMPPGLGAPGAMAEYMIVDRSRHLVPIGDLDPVSAVPLTDAGLTPYHAIKPSLPKLVPAPPPSSSARAASGTWASRSSRPSRPARSSPSTSVRTSSPSRAR